MRRALGPCAHRITHVAVNGVLLMAVGLFGFLAVGPHLVGYRTETMLTGSMVPVVNVGDAVVVAPEPTSKVEPGQILTFQPPIAGAGVVTHRVLAARHQPGGSVVIRTKGDANPTPDPWRAVVRPGQAWQVRAVLPHLGELIRTLRVPWLNHVLTWGVPGLLALWLLRALWRPAGAAPA